MLSFGMFIVTFIGIVVAIRKFKQ
ncbi:putative holin-like toxin [Staphylococcus aureus]